MNVQYGDARLSLQQVYEWTGKFMNGISSVTDCPRPSQAHRVVTPEATAAVEAMVKDLKERRVDDCQELLKRFEAEGDGFLGRTVTGDEIWVHYHQPETEKASKAWRHTSSPKPKKFRIQPSAGKVMLPLFGMNEG